MNNHDELDAESNQDDLLTRLLSPLNQLRPSLEGQVQNRAAIADALQKFRSGQEARRKPWWTRSISIPVPVAAVFALAACVVSSVGLFRAPPQIGPVTVSGAGRVEEEVVSSSRANVPRTVQYRETETELYGIGPVNQESGFFTQE